MEELYWITRLDSFLRWTAGVKGISWVILGCVCVTLFIYYIGILVDEVSEEYIKSDRGKRFKRTLRAFGIPSAVVIFITSLILIFVPSTKEACMIYLGGSVVDYVQGSDKIQEMPDKVVNLASEYLDELVTRQQGESKQVENQEQTK